MCIPSEMTLAMVGAGCFLAGIGCSVLGLLWAFRRDYRMHWDG